MNDEQFIQLHICCPKPIPWPLKQRAFLIQALKILLRQSWHWLLWGHSTLAHSVFWFVPQLHLTRVGEIIACPLSLPCHHTCV